MIILGEGGFAREVAGILYDVHELFHSDIAPIVTMHSDSALQSALYSATNGYNNKTICYIGVGDPKLKERWALELAANSFYCPPLIASTARIRDYNRSTKIGDGSIICDGTVITTNVTIGKFVTLNLNCTVGHDSVIGDFTTIAPGTNISGNVKIGRRLDIGSNVVIIPGVELPDGGIVGAGSVVTKTPTFDFYVIDAETRQQVHPFKEVESYVMVGNPAKVIKVNGQRV